MSLLRSLVCRSSRLHTQGLRDVLYDLNCSIHIYASPLPVSQHWTRRSQLLQNNSPRKHLGTGSLFSWIRDPQDSGHPLSYWTPIREDSILWVSWDHKWITEKSEEKRSRSLLTTKWSDSSCLAASLFSIWKTSNNTQFHCIDPKTCQQSQVIYILLLLTLGTSEPRGNEVGGSRVTISGWDKVYIYSFED